MVHNGIEYGLMQAYAEGFELMRPVRVRRSTCPRSPGIWRYGSVVRSWLLELLHAAFEQHGDELDDIAPYVEDSGEGRWTINAAIDDAVPAAGDHRRALRPLRVAPGRDRFAAKVHAALRNQFGGHAVRAVAKAKPSDDPRVTSAQENPLLEGLRLRRTPGPVRARHLRRVRRPDAAQALPGALLARRTARLLPERFGDRRRRAHASSRRRTGSRR